MKTLLIMCMLLCTQTLYSQSLSFFDIDTTNFPSMKAKFFAFDKDGNQVRPSLNELGLKENGISRTITNVNCPPPVPPKALSSVLVIDVSGSMSNGAAGIPKIDLAKAAARVWVNALPLGKSECAITSFDDYNYLNQDFTTNRTKLLNAINALQPKGGTDYDAALINPMAGGLLVSKNRKYQKVLVFISDGQPNDEPKTSRIVAEARNQGCVIYAVTLGLPAPQSLKDIASQTGGQVFENVITQKQVEDVYQKILQMAQGSSPCTIEWTSEFSCTAGNTGVELSWQSEKSQSAYTTSANAIAALEVSPNFIRFGKRIPNTSHDTTITLTARNADFTVIGINRKFGTSDFTIVNTNFPITIPKNESRVITLRFAPTDSNVKYASYEISADKCPSYFSANGGIPSKKNQLSTLKLTYPNGGEKFVAGSDTLITWTGISPTDTVSLDYSIDGGKKWKIITDKAVGLQYHWKNIPLPPSTQCLVRVTQGRSAAADDTTTVITLRGHMGLGFVYGISYHPGGSTVATASNDKTAKIWDAATGTELRTLTGHTSYVVGIAYSHDGSKVATASYDNTAKIWDANTGTELRTLTGHIGPVNGISYSPNGRYVATASADFTAKIWDTNTGTELRTLSHTGWLNAIACSPDGSRVATAASADKTAKIWDANTGTLIRTLTGHTLGGITFGEEDIAYSPDGSRVATVSVDNTAKIWDANTGTLIRTLNGHTAQVNGISYSPDGRYVATASADFTAKIWDANTGIVFRTLMGHRGGVNAIAYSPDGSRVATASDDNTAKIWEIESILQEDQSDAAFSIVVPQLSSSDIDMGKVLVTTTKDSVLVSLIKNTGTWRCRVDSLFFRGADANAFRLVSGVPPYSVAAGNSYYGEIRFAPKRVGIHNAEMVIITQVDTIIQQITGEGVQQQLEIAEKLIDFGIVGLGDNKDSLQCMTIRNIGTVPITITRTSYGLPNDKDFSTIAGNNSFVLNPGDPQLMDLRFFPSDSGRTSGTLEFHYNGLGSPAIIQLFGEGRKKPQITHIVGAFKDLLCEQELTDSIRIKNDGAMNLIISDIQISGTHKDDFIVTQKLPFVIEPWKVYSLPVLFKPQSTGVKTASISLSSNAENKGQLTIPITGKKDAVLFTCSKQELDFGSVPFNAQPFMEFELVNTGNIPTTFNISCPSTMNLSETSVSLPPLGNKILRVEYKGSATTTDITGDIIVREINCQQEITVKLSGTVFSAFASLQSPNKSGYAGEEIEIPIQLTSQKNIAQSGITNIDIDMTFNPTLLSPIGYTVEIINDTLGKISMKNIAIIAENDRVLHTLRCKVGLGNAEDCVLELSNLTLHGGNANINLINGRFTLLGICEEGGTRLVNPGKATTLMRIHPNPSKGIMSVDLELIEQGLTTLRIYDVQGAVIAEREIYDSLGTVQSVFDITKYGAGMYYIEVRTPTMIRKEKIVIEK